MIYEKIGNLLDQNVDIICHQVNCRGVMGAGIAKQIKEECYYAYEVYNEFCKTFEPEKLLGKCLIVNFTKNRRIANIFGQLNYGRNGQYTNYNALKDGFNIVKKFAEEYNFSVGIPYGIGCGLAGGIGVLLKKLSLIVFRNLQFNVIYIN